MLLAMDGLDGSIREARIWEQHTSLPSISTVTGLQLANAAGIPILSVDQDNVAQFDQSANLDYQVIAAVDSEVQQGFTVMIPSQILTMNEWPGSVWIAANPATGQAAGGRTRLVSAGPEC